MQILLVDDEIVGRKSLAKYLERHLGHDVIQCDSGQAALKHFEEGCFPLVLTDIRMPGLDGIELLKKLKELPQGRTADIVMITQHGEMKTVLAALRAGAYDYLTKPIDLEELAAVVNRIVEHQTLIKENFELTHHFEKKVAEATHATKTQLEKLQCAYAEIVGIGRVGVFSAAMRQVVSMAQTLHGDRMVPVLIEGETGTGKEIIARMIHYGAERTVTPFVAINCSAFPPHLFESELFGYEAGAFTGAKRKGQIGKFELAQGGTIFLDEIGDMPLELQPKLLRVLQEREFYRVGGVKKIELDIRVICASNREMAKLMEEGVFRKDLFYRFDIGRIQIPPLRERKEEIEPLAQMFLELFAEQKKRQFNFIHKAAVKILKNHSWPGNVRQLQNTIERVVLNYDETELRPEHLNFLRGDDGNTLTTRHSEREPDSITVNIFPDGMDLKAVEEEIVQAVLAKFNGNKTRTAAYFGISRNSLRRKLKKT